ncbi:MAG TPA: hypothetical protein VF407_25070 [Polyangiaceae bacterium]
MLSRLWIGRIALALVASTAVVASAIGCGSSSDGDEPPLDVDNDSGIVTGGIYDVVYTQERRAGAYASSGHAVAVYGVADEASELSQQCKNDGYATQSTKTGANAACTIVVCTDPLPDGDDDGGTGYTPDSPQPTSGAVTLTTTLVPAGVTMTPDESGICTTGDDPVAAQWWTGGDNAITVSSVGGLVPAIRRTGLVGPGELSSITFDGLELTGSADAGADPDAGEPDPDSDFTGPTVTLSRGKPVAVTFAGGIAGTSIHLVLQTQSTAQERVIDCTFDGAQTSQTLPAADLSSLLVTDDGDVIGGYYVDTLTQSAAKSGSWNIQARLVELGPDAPLVVGN